ncbi:MAG: hypothetical protein Q9218_003442 [Villophora microphyllina]
MAIVPTTTAATESVLSAVLILLGLLVVYAVIKAIYNIYFHPLSKYPEPKAAAATKIPVAYVSWIGRLSHWQLALHERYDSDVVRISPDELSFISATAWKDMYGTRQGNANPFAKNLLLHAGVNSIVAANDADHSRIRRLLSHAFSDKALREQAPLIQTYVNNLMSGLRNQCTVSRGKVDLAKWFNWTTFDVIGDLAFGEPFDCLKDNTYQPWVAMLMGNLKFVVFMSVILRFPPLSKLATRLIPKKIIQARIDHRRMSKEKVERRLESTTDRPDFMAHIIRHNGTKGGMSTEELCLNSADFIAAGSETTATLLAGAVWSLLNNPVWMDKLKDEIRSTFTMAHDIRLQDTDGLKLLHAVISESFRMYPPGIGVSLNQYAANMSHRNFSSPWIFAPSRWLGDPQYVDDKLDVVQPFSVGARNCIGRNLAKAEIALILTRLVWEFDIALAEETDKNWPDQKAWFTWQKKPLVVEIRERGPP